MSGIYGISDREAPVERSKALCMGAALVEGGGAGAKYSQSGRAFIGAAGTRDMLSVAEMHGLIVAVESDLTNLDELRQSYRLDARATAAEVVAAGYRRHGIDCVQALDGAFAIALWDPSMEQVLIAVDRYGFRTLYWSSEGDRFMFASRIAAIEAATDKPLEVDRAAVMQYLVHTVVPAPLTIYTTVKRLEPGTQVTYRNGVARERRYWDLQYQETEGKSVGAWREELREHMRDAVRQHLHGCRPGNTGAYLSGGTDSSSVVAFASEVMSPFNSFSIYFENPRYDEVDFARTAAARFHTRHHEQRLEAGDAAEALPKIVEQYEEPFANSSVIGAYECARLAKQNGVDMLLAGDGGDELFAGNERYATDKKFAVYGSLPKPLRFALSLGANALAHAGPLSLPARYIRRAEIPNPQRMFSYNFFLTKEGVDELDSDLVHESGCERALQFVNRHFQSAPMATSDLNRLLYLDVKMTLSDNDLRKVIGTAELAGVRVRFPLLDRKLTEFSGTLPARLKLKGLTKRYIFKEAMKGVLPEKILHKKKHGFGVPVGYWLLSTRSLSPLLDILDEPAAQQRGYLRRGAIERIKRLTQLHPAYFGEVLWTALMLELWHRRHRSVRSSEAEYARIGAARAV